MKRNGKIKSHFREYRTSWIVTILTILLLLAILWPSVFITIHAGEAGVFYSRFRGGTEVDKVYSEGVHVVAPWDIMTIYNVRFQTNPHEMDVLTVAGMQVHVWTLNGAVHWAAALQAGVDAVITDDPGGMKTWLAGEGLT